jgi:pimeloyl-ACP methyl ester carboxylesterase
MTVHPFTIEVPQATLDDLQRRLARTRWPAPIDGVGWSYGADLDYMQELVSYWQHGYDWRAHEAKLNQFAHFKATIDGLGIHFIHERGKGPSPLPLVLTHGWPDSFYRFSKVIPLLTDPASHGGDPADAFDVVAPSVPGMGFSERPRTRGMSSGRTAELWAALMRDELGYGRFGAVGGDVGSEVTMHLAHTNPELLVGISLTDVSYPQAAPEGVAPSEDDGRYFGELGQWFADEAAYFLVQGTKPQSIGYELNDSPAGLAAWLVEKFESMGGKGVPIEERFSKDELLTNLMIYWATETGTSAARRYYEGFQSGESLWPAPRIEVPTGIAHFNDLLPPRSWVEAAMNVQRWSEIGSGGHFAALEVPELFAEELRAFFRPLRGIETRSMA